MHLYNLYCQQSNSNNPLCCFVHFASVSLPSWMDAWIIEWVRIMNEFKLTQTKVIMQSQDNCTRNLTKMTNWGHVLILVQIDCSLNSSVISKFYKYSFLYRFFLYLTQSNKYISKIIKNSVLFSSTTLTLHLKLISHAILFISLLYLLTKLYFFLNSCPNHMYIN